MIAYKTVFLNRRSIDSCRKDTQQCLLTMWNLGIHIISTGSESPGLRENQHSVLSANLCTKFKNDNIKNILLKTHLVLPIPVEIICTDSTCLSNSINTFIFSFRDRKKL